MTEITKWPMVILTNYRTGSSAFGVSLRPRRGFNFFGEPAQDPVKLEKFINFYHSGNSEFILKIMIDQLDDCNLYRSILDSDCHKIRLMRKNEIEQSLSYYIARTRGVWQQYIKDSIHSPYTVPIDINNMNWAADIITTNNKKLRESTIEFDQEYVYENLSIPDSSNFCKIMPPANTNELMAEMTKIVLNKI